MPWHSKYHAAYRDLQALLLAVNDEQASRLAAGGEWPLTVEFRLHRFDSHLRQHTIYAEKVLQALDLLPGEALRLLWLVYNALAEAEGMLIGAGEIGQTACRSLAKEIE